MATGFFKTFDFFTNELEACQNVHQCHAVCFANWYNHFGTYNGLDDCAICRQSTICFLLRKDIFCQQCAYHIPSQYHKFAFVIAYHCTHTVTVGVSADNDVRTFFFRQFLRKHEYFGVFWVWIANGRKFCIWQFLFWYHKYMLETCFFQRTTYWQIARAMQRCIHDFECIAHFCNQ